MTGLGYLTLTCTSPSLFFAFTMGPARISESWERDMMDFDIPYSFFHQVTDWVSTAQSLTVSGKLVNLVADDAGIPRSLQWWKNEMQELLTGPGANSAQGVWELDDGCPDSDGLQLFGGSNVWNRYVKVKRLTFDFEGGNVNSVDYVLTLTICDKDSV